jgi:hypothetical protein
MLTWHHGGGFSLDASVRIEATDRTGLERLIRYCARPPFALDRLHLVGGRSDQVLYVLPGPDPAGRTALRLSALEFLDRLAKILPPPQTELDMGLAGGEREKAAQESSPDDPDQTPEFDPTDPEPTPEDDFDQSWSA